LGRQISQPVNTNGAKAAQANFFLSRKILSVDIQLHAASSFARTATYINADLSRNDAYTSGGGFSLSKYVTDKYSADLVTNFIYFDQVSSINTAAPVRYWTQSHQSSFTLFLIPKFEINTNAVYTWQEKSGNFAGNTSVLLWNGYINRNFLQDKLIVKFQVNNILNANSGMNRNNIGNINTQSSTNILGRSWMFSLAYHFDHKFKRK
jgi:hypothetical protein